MKCKETVGHEIKTGNYEECTWASHQSSPYSRE